MEFIDRKTIRLDKTLSDLDAFVLDFINILERHVSYVIISGYVSILFGRARATEDIDVFVPELDEGRFAALYSDLIKEGYWCLNTEEVGEAYSYLKEGIAIRFARENETIPNVEIKFARKPPAREALKDFITVVTSKGRLRISSLEQQIAAKRYYLKSDKDFEDARHIEELFKEHIDKKKVEAYRRMFEHETA